MDKCSVCSIEIENPDDVYKEYLSREATILCYECYINGTCGCCDEYVPEGELLYLGEPLGFVEYMDKAVKKMLVDGYFDVCFGCLECQAEQIEHDERDDLAWSAFTTGRPDIFSDEMRWYWRAE